MIEGAPMFAARLRAEMKQRGMTQQDLADHLGYTQTAISYWTAGKRQPSLADLCRVAGAFEVTTDYMLGMRRREVVVTAPGAEMCGEGCGREAVVQTEGMFTYCDPCLMHFLRLGRVFAAAVAEGRNDLNALEVVRS